ncbi:MAG: hypothetical protein ACXAC2_14070 [Candidatus Kariarchaeaceae archaeon]|jgi:hypothetical protein
MKSSSLLFLILFSSVFLAVQPVKATDGYLYEETISGITRVDNEYFRWTEEREFLIIDYTPQSINGSKEILITLQDSSQRGRIETIVQPYLEVNFELTQILNSDNSPLEYNWDMYLFRNTSKGDNYFLSSAIRSGFAKSEQRLFDLDTENLFFSVNLQHYEFEGGLNSKRYQVNTELSTKNHADGRIEKTAIHLKKVDNDDNTVFEYSWEIQEKSTFQRYLNYLDQPSLVVPLQIALALLIVYIYIRVHKYWTENEIKIIKGKGKVITIETTDIPEDTELTDNSETE